jgi:hypothetical protein
MKKCALATSFFIVIVSLKVLTKNTGDDPAGFIALCLMGILATSVVATFMEVLKKPIKIF